MIVRLPPKVQLPPDLVNRVSSLQGDVPGYAYCRISQDRVGAGLGVVRQLGDICTLAEQQNVRLVAVFLDNDVSASSGKPRPDYRAMLDGLRAGRARMVLSWHTDRLHRSPLELEEYITVSETGSVPTVCVKAGHLDLSTPSGRLVARQLGAVARYEVEHNSEKIKSKMTELAMAGNYRGGPRPFGFEKDGVTVRPAEAVEIIHACNAILAGGTLRQIAADWNRQELYGTRGGSWAATTVRQVLIRARNAGLIEHEGEIVGSAQWPALVTEPVWRAVCSVLADPSRRTTVAGNQPRWLGSGLYLCHGCERPDLRVSGPSSLARTYRCAARKTAKDGRHHVARGAVPLDNFVERVIVARLSRPDAADLLESRDDVDVAALQTERTALHQRLEDLDDDLNEHLIDRARWLRSNEKTRAKIAEIDIHLAGAVKVNPLAGLVGVPDVAAAWFGTLPDRSDGLPLDRRRAVLDLLMTVTVLPAMSGRNLRGEIDPDTVRFDPKR